MLLSLSFSHSPLSIDRNTFLKFVNQLFSLVNKTRIVTRDIWLSRTKMTNFRDFLSVSVGNKHDWHPRPKDELHRFRGNRQQERYCWWVTFYLRSRTIDRWSGTVSSYGIRRHLLKLIKCRKEFKNKLLRKKINKTSNFVNRIKVSHKLCEVQMSVLTDNSDNLAWYLAPVFH